MGMRYFYGSDGNVLGLDMVMLIPLMWDVIVMVSTIMVIPQNCEYSLKKLNCIHLSGFSFN